MIFAKNREKSSFLVMFETPTHRLQRLPTSVRASWNFVQIQQTNTNESFYKAKIRGTVRNLELEQKKHVKSMDRRWGSIMARVLAPVLLSWRKLKLLCSSYLFSSLSKILHKEFYKSLNVGVQNPHITDGTKVFRVSSTTHKAKLSFLY